MHFHLTNEGASFEVMHLGSCIGTPRSCALVSKLVYQCSFCISAFTFQPGARTPQVCIFVPCIPTLDRFVY